MRQRIACLLTRSIRQRMMQERATASLINKDMKLLIAVVAVWVCLLADPLPEITLQSVNAPQQGQR